MIWRDDDIAVETRGPRLALLQQADDVLASYGVSHTIAVIADRLETNPALIDCIRSRHMVPQLHGWTHEDLTTDPAALAALPQAVDVLERLFGRPTILYPPWNRSNAAVDAMAQRLGLHVSTRKASLEQFLRAGGDVAEDTVNFHHWHPPDLAHLDEALRLYRTNARTMKITDYCPRAAPFDTYLRAGRDLVGVEVGVDVGAHADALLRHCAIAQLTLVDPWPRDYALGYCEGRLSALGFRPRFRMLQASSAKAASQFAAGSLDFVYIDQQHDGPIVAEDLRIWWPTVKVGGVLGYRNYTDQPIPLVQAVDAFVTAQGPTLEAHVETGEMVLVKLA